MKTVGIIGAGRVGGAVARLATAAGYSVVISNSRGPDSLAELVAELGTRARAATPADAARAADIVVVSVPVRAMADLPAGALADRIVLDTINYDPRLHGNIESLDATTLGTSELLQEHLPGARVVKALNNIFFRTLHALARPSGSGRTALPIAGDDAAAKVEVARFLDAIGYDTVDAGPLAEGWRFQPGTPAHTVYAGETIQDPAPADAGRVREALAAATRTAPAAATSATPAAATSPAPDPTSPAPAAATPAPTSPAGQPDQRDQPRVLGATDEERRLIEMLYRAIGGEPDLLDDVLAPDWEDIPSIPGQQPGPAGMKPHIEEFHRSFAGARVIVRDVVAASGVVAVRGALAGTLRGEFAGVAPTGRYDEIAIHEFHQIENGRIRRSWHLEDLHGWAARMTG